MTGGAPAGFLRRRNRQPCAPVAFEGRRLVEADVGKVIALHALARAGLQPDLVATETDGFFADHVYRAGRILGLFAEGGLIAYGVLGLPRPGDFNFGEMIDLPEDERPRVANVDGVGVAPEWRGNALHRVLIAWRLAEAEAAGRSIAITTAAPGNLPSVRNLMAEGMKIRALREKFGGWRYVMRRDLGVPHPPPPSEGHWVAVDDIPAQMDFLRRGTIGWALAMRDGHYHVWYAAPVPA